MERMSKYEKARIIGARALQISMGAPTELDVEGKDLQDLHPVDIAIMEFEKGVIPLRAVRKN